MFQFKTLAQLIEEGVSVNSVDVNGVKMVSLSNLTTVLQRIRLINTLRVAILPDGPPDPGTILK